MKKYTSKRIKEIEVGDLIFKGTDGELKNIGKGAISLYDEELNKDFYMFFGCAKTGIIEIDFINYLLQSARKNVVIYQKDEIIAKRIGTSRQTIERIKKKLQDADVIKYNKGVIFINPRVYFKGKAKFRQEIAEEYEGFIEFKEKKREEEHEGET